MAGRPTLSTEPRLARRIALLSFAAFASALSARIGDPLLPLLARHFGLGVAAVTPTVSAFAFAYGCVQLAYGPVGDRYGKYHVVAWATLACVVGALGSAAAGTLGALIAFRALTGMTAAALIPLSMAWIADHTPYEGRQPVLARFLSGQILGLASGQLLGGALADLVGWRGAFLFLAAVYAAAGILLAREIGGARGSDRFPRPAAAAAPFLVQVRDVLRRAWARAILAWVFLEGTAAVGAFAFAPTFLHRHFGLSLGAAGALMSLFGLGGLVYALLSRRLVARLGEQGLAIGGGLLIAAAFIALGLAPRWIWVAPAALGAGLGFYMLHNTLQTQGTQMAPASRGTAVGIFATCLFLGQGIGVATAGWLDEHSGPRAVFAGAAAVLAAVGASFGLTLRWRAQEAAADAGVTPARGAQ